MHCLHVPCAYSDYQSTSTFEPTVENEAVSVRSMHLHVHFHFLVSLCWNLSQLLSHISVAIVLSCLVSSEQNSFDNKQQPQKSLDTHSYYAWAVHDIMQYTLAALINITYSHLLLYNIAVLQFRA